MPTRYCQSAAGIAAAVLFFCFSLVISQTEAGLSGNPTRGRDHFVRKGCIRCHGIWGAGQQIGPDLVKVGMGRSLFEIASSMWNHAPAMSLVMQERSFERPLFTAVEIQDLLAYLYYLNYFTEPGDPTEGMRIFSEKGCVNCHSVRNVGGQGGPQLDTFGRYGTPLYMSQAMWNHGPKMTDEIKRRNVPQPVFEKNEMSHLLAFIRGKTVGGIPLGGDVLGNPSSGRRLFAEKACDQCHTVDGSGERMGPDLGVAARELSVTDMAGQMWNHSTTMWARMEELNIPRPVFSANEMADLIGYIYFVGFSGGRGDRSRGSAVFRNKGCAGCHSLENRSESGAPDLSDSPVVASPFEFLSALWNHSMAMERRMQERGMDWPLLDEIEMRDLSAYLASLH